MVDMTNALQPDFEKIFLASNASGIFPEDTARLNKSTNLLVVPFITRALVGNSFAHFPRAARLLITLPFLVLSPLFFVYNVTLFVGLIKKYKPSRVLSCNGGYPAAQACLAMVVASKICHIPVMLSIVSMPIPRKSWSRVYEKTIDALIWKSADRIVVNSEAIAKALTAIRDAIPEKIRVIYNGLECQPASPSNRDDKNFIIGCVARMDAAKGVLFLFEAFVRLANKYPDVRLILAGQGDASAELTQRIAALGLQSKVQLLGHYEGSIDLLLSKFDVYVFPSLWEGFPYSIIEALRSGCVIVATAVGGIPEAIVHGRDGLLIRPGEIDDIVVSIERLMASAALRLELASNARLRFERELTLDKMKERVKDVLVGQNN